jgi:hypothetical protein
MSGQRNELEVLCLGLDCLGDFGKVVECVEKEDVVVCLKHVSMTSE